MQKIEISKFKANCHALLKRVHKTRKPIVVTRDGEPIAQIAPPPTIKPRKRVLGAMAGTGRIVGDIVSPVVDESDWEVLR